MVIFGSIENERTKKEKMEKIKKKNKNEKENKIFFVVWLKRKLKRKYKKK